MCGACARPAAGDWLSPAVVTRTERAVAARTVTSLVHRTGTTVRAEAQGYSVRRPTGRVVLAPGLVAVWSQVHGSAPVPMDLPGSDAAFATAGLPPPVVGALLVLLLADSPATVASLWSPDVVAPAADASALAGLLAATPVTAEHRPRVLVWAPPAAAVAALAAVTDPAVRLRGTVVALVRCGDGPAWADDLGPDLALADRCCLDAVLGGVPSGVEWLPHVSVPAAAAWVAGRVADGSTAGRRLTVVAGRDAVLFDAAHGRGLVVRACPSAVRDRADRWGRRRCTRGA